MKKIFFVFFTLAIVVSVFFGYKSVMAALPGDEGLTLSPPLKELNLNPGDSSVQTLKLTNPTGKLVELYPKVMDFSAKGETGEPGFSDPAEDGGKYSLAKWITLSQSKIALTPEQVVEYKYIINVPQDAEPGGHYGVVFFATEPPALEQDQSKVALSSMVGGLVMVKVPGDVAEKAAIEEFSTDKIFYIFNKVKLTTRVKNLGNVHIKPIGDIKVKSLFGRTVDILVFNPQKGNVLPESTRKFENDWQSKKILIGPYKTQLEVNYGEQKVALGAVTTIWIFPWWLLVILAVIMIAVIVLIIVRRAKGTKKNKNKPQKPGPQGPVLIR